MNTDKTLEDKIYRVLLTHGPSSKEISKVFKDEIEVLLKQYKKRLNYLSGQLILNIEKNQRIMINTEYNVLKQVILDLGELLKWQVKK